MDVKNCALVVVDMQRSFFDMELNYLPIDADDADRIIKKMKDRVLPIFRKYNIPIIFIKTVHRISSITKQPMSLSNPFWLYQMEKTSVTGVGHKRGSKSIEGSPVAEIMPQLEVKPEDYIVVKQRYSPFIGTDMEHIMRCLDIKTIFVTGVNTNNCVLSTVFEAFNRDIAVVVLEDCCASMNGKEYHDNAIKQIKASLGWVINSDMVESLLKEETHL